MSIADAQAAAAAAASGGDGEVAGEEDTPVTRDGVTVLIDSMSYPYLVGSTVDYAEDLMGSKFAITNPNASTTCGCGASFSI